MEEEYKRLIEEIRDVYFIVQQERLVLVSNYTAELYGYSKDEIIGKPFLDLVAPEERNRLSEYYRSRIAEHRAPERYESIFLAKDGTRIPGEVSVWLTHYNGKSAVAGIVTNITERKLIMEKLQESEEKYRSIVENSPDIIYTADPEGVVHSVNGAIKNILGFTAEEIIGRKFMDFIPPQAMSQVMKDHNQLCRGDNVNSNILSINKDGVERILDFRSVPILKDGIVVKAQGIIRDITDRMRAEEKLNRMFDSMTDGVLVTDLDGFITEINERTANLHGYNRKDDLLGKYALELVSQSDKKKARENMVKLLEIGMLKDIEYTLVRKNGSEFYGEVSASVLMDAFDKPEGFISVVRDITGRKQMEEKYRQLLEDMNDGYGVIRDGRYVFTNRSFCEIFGYNPGEMLGMPIGQKFATPDACQAAEEQYKRVLHGEEAVPERHESEVIKKDGTPIIVETSIKLIEYEAAQAASVIVRDVTGHKQAEEKYRQLLEDMSDGYAVIQDGKYVFTNSRFCSLFGLEPGQLQGKAIGCFINPEQYKIKMQEYERIIHDGQPPAERYEDDIVVADGRTMVLETSIRAITYEDNAALGVITRDITERKRAETALRESSEMLRLMFECAPYGVTIMDLDAVIIDANDQACKICGCNTRSELIGRSGLEFLTKQQLNKALRDINQCLKEGMIIGFEYNIKKDDGSKISAQTSAGVLKGIDDKPIGLISITRDITEEKQLRENKQFYITEIIKAQENERRNLARTLHDATVQELLLASHRLQDAISGNHGRLPRRTQKYLEELRTLIEQTMTEVRGFSVDLRPGVLDDMGLIPALRWLTKKLSEEEGIDSSLKVTGKERRLSSDTELTLFRIAQECLSNVRKHSQASIANVTLEFDDKKIILSVVDNGRGFKLPHVISQFTREHKLGLTGITERVNLLGGKYKLESFPGKGTAVRVEINE